MSPALLVHALVAGGSLLALWIYVRLGERRRPASFRRAGAHMALAGVALALAPVAIAELMGGSRSPLLAAVGLFVVFLPVMTYVFLAALFVLAELQRARWAQR